MWIAYDTVVRILAIGVSASRREGDTTLCWFSADFPKTLLQILPRAD